MARVGLAVMDVQPNSKAFLEANYPGDANWNLAEYVLFGGGQIIL